MTVNVRISLLVCCLLGAGFLFLAEEPEPIAPVKISRASVASSPNPVSLPQNVKKAKFQNLMAGLPLRFEKNLGQVADEVAFYSRGNGYAFYLTPEESVVVLSRILPKEKSSHPDEVTEPTIERSVVRMKLVGGNPNPAISGEDVLPGTSHYWVGNDPSKWRDHVESFRRVRYEEVYPGIDLVYYGNQKKLEYDFVVKSGANPEDILIDFQGADRISLDSEGDLVLKTKNGDIVQKAPAIYQEVSGQRVRINGHYKIQSDNRVAFNIATYDSDQPLIIDPAILISTFLGGTNSDTVEKISLDASGNIYLTGYTFSTDFNTVNPIETDEPGRDIFVTKMAQTGSTFSIVYSTYLGGDDADTPVGIVVDASSNVYVAGYTDSTDFNLLNSIEGDSAGRDIVVFKISESGAIPSLAFSTYLGGSGADQATDIALDSSGNIFVSGWTNSTDFDTFNAYQANQPDEDGFFLKIQQPGSVPSLVFSSYLGGSGFDRAFGIGLDSADNIFLVGTTESSNFPVLNSIHSTGTVFVSKFSPAGNSVSLDFSTLFGGTTSIGINDVFVDSDGNVYAAGAEIFGGGMNFTLVNEYEGYPGSDAAVFFKVEHTGSVPSIGFSSYLGGTAADWAESIAVDSTGKIHIGGNTYSQDFDTVNSIHAPPSLNNAQGFISQFEETPSGLNLVFSTYLGGDGGYDIVNSLAVDSSDNLYATGLTQATDFPVKNSIQTYQGANEAFLVKLGDPEGLEFVQSASSVSEGAGTASIEVILHETIASQVTVDYLATGITATVGSDFTATSGRLTFNPGDTIKFIQVPLLNDTLPEGNETLQVALSNPVGISIFTNSTHTLTILDDEPLSHLSFASSSSSKEESVTSVQIPVSLSNAQGLTVTVDYSVTGGTATGGGVDYTLNSGTLTFNPGETSKNISITVVDDNIPEANETVVLTLSNPTNGSLVQPTSHTFEISNNDNPSVLSFSGTGSGTSEHEGLSDVAVFITPAIQHAGSVDYRFTPGTATNGVDYTSVDGTLQLSPGDTVKHISFSIHDDNLLEGNETFGIVIENPVNHVLGSQTTLTYTILDDEGMPEFSFGSSGSMGNESQTTVSIPVFLVPAPTSVSTVDYDVSAGTATDGVDFVPASGTLTFQAGESQKSITFQVIDDAEFENDESVVIKLSHPSSGLFTTFPSEHIYTIQNDDDPPLPPSANGDSPAPEVVTPYWQNGDGVYSFISVTHPSLDGLNSQVGVSVSAFLTNGDLVGRSAFTIDAGQTKQLFFIRSNHPSINPTNFPSAAFIFTDPATIGVNSTGGIGFLRMDSVATDPKTTLSGPGGGYPDARMLAYWGAVVLEGESLGGFALEFIGDLNDSASHPGMAPGLFPSGVN